MHFKKYNSKDDSLEPIHYIVKRGIGKGESHPEDECDAVVGDYEGKWGFGPADNLTAFGLAWLSVTRLEAVPIVIPAEPMGWGKGWFGLRKTHDESPFK